MTDPTNPAVESPSSAPATIAESAPPPPAVPHDAAVRELFARGKNGAAWFYWISALSVVNTIIVLAEGGRRFALGLVVTMISDAIAARALKPGGDMKILAIALCFNAFVLGLFVVCGRLSQRRILPIYALGMVLYLLDGLLSLRLGGYVGIGIHVWALCSMWSGFWAYRQLNVLERQMMAAGLASQGSI
jgi:hypothetical protein